MNTSAGNRRARIGIALSGVGIAVAIGVTIGTPTAEADAPPTVPNQTRIALDDLTKPGSKSVSATMPAGFADSYYTPTIEGGLLVDPDGDCSSPIPLPSEFDIACKAHDLGYDLIRFGGPSATTTNARKDLDTRLGARMHDSCTARPELFSRASCTVMADIAVTAVRFNSWRQHFGVPAPEPALPFLIAGGLGVAVTGLAASTFPLRIQGEHDAVTA